MLILTLWEIDEKVDGENYFERLHRYFVYSFLPLFFVAITGNILGILKCDIRVPLRGNCASHVLNIMHKIEYNFLPGSLVLSVATTPTHGVVCSFRDEFRHNFGQTILSYFFVITFIDPIPFIVHKMISVLLRLI